MPLPQVLGKAVVRPPSPGFPVLRVLTHVHGSGHLPSASGCGSGGLPSRWEYRPPQGVLLPRVYGTPTSPLWLELRGLSAWQATPCWAVYRVACQRSLPWLRVTFAMVPEAAWPASDQRPWGTAPAAGPLVRLDRRSAFNPRGVLCCYLYLRHPRCVHLCGVLSPWALGHRCARLVCSVCGVLGCSPPVHQCVCPAC